MNTLAPVVARIILRYLSGALLVLGLLPPEIAKQIGVDPDLTLLLSVIIAAAVEAAYALAKRKGWLT